MNRPNLPNTRSSITRIQRPPKCDLVLGVGTGVAATVPSPHDGNGGSTEDLANVAAVRQRQQCASSYALSIDRRRGITRADTKAHASTHVAQAPRILGSELIGDMWGHVRHWSNSVRSKALLSGFCLLSGF
jgi:hypothetical protein